MRSRSTNLRSNWLSKSRATLCSRSSWKAYALHKLSQRFIAALVFPQCFGGLLQILFIWLERFAAWRCVRHLTNHPFASFSSSLSGVYAEPFGCGANTRSSSIHPVPPHLEHRVLIVERLIISPDVNRLESAKWRVATCGIRPFRTQLHIAPLPSGG